MQNFELRAGRCGRRRYWAASPGRGRARTAASLHEDHGSRSRVFNSDLKEKRVVTTHDLIEEFVNALAAHMPERHLHVMRSFGLLAPPRRVGIHPVL